MTRPADPTVRETDAPGHDPSAPTETVLVRAPDAETYAAAWSAQFPQAAFLTDDRDAEDRITVVAGRVTDEELQRRPRLRWVHSWAAGVEGDLGPAVRDAAAAGTLTVTSSAGNGAIPLAEQAMMLALMLDRDAPRWAEAQREQRWERRTHGELHGRTLGIYGYGNVGRALATRARAFGMRVLAVRRSTAPDERVDAFFAPDALLEVARQCDVLVVAAPLTRETRGAIDRSVLGALPDGALVIVVSRGGIVDDDALLEALQAGRLRAGLDAHHTEPLPTDSPFWRAPGTIVTPHNGATTLATADRGREIFTENLRRRLLGDPMTNIVDVTTLV